MDRYLSPALLADLPRKILLLTGPRQCGKTTLARSLVPNHQYLNHDLAEHRLILREKSWDRSLPLVIFGELHKMPRWKSWLKGIYDVEGIPPALLATGSARLSAFRKSGDSLAGRHFEFRLHPLDMKEALAYTDLGRDEIFKRLMQVGGFPEPFLDGGKAYYNRWKRSHIDMILREDLVTLTAIRDIQAVETLIELLRTRIGSPVSANALAVDLQKSPATVQNWLKLLEDLYVIFRVNPYNRNVARAILKSPKYYFYDNAMVQGGPGIVLENLVACAVLKEVHRAADVDGENFGLHYVRNKEGAEIDFLLTRNQRPHLLIEVKWQDDSLTPHFRKLLPSGSHACIQVVGELARNKSFQTGERIVAAKDFLGDFALT